MFLEIGVFEIDLFRQTLLEDQRLVIGELLDPVVRLGNARCIANGNAIHPP